MPAPCAALTLCLFAAAACGFQPMYGERAAVPATASPQAAGSVSRDLAAVSVARIPDRPGQELRNELADQLNPARYGEPSRYTLNVRLRRDSRELSIDRQGLATRGSLKFTARYSLTDDASGRVMLKSTARAVVGYDILSGQPTSYFSTLTSRQDAQSRALTQVAGQISARLGAFFYRYPGGLGAAVPAAAAVEPAFTSETDAPLDDIADDGDGDDIGDDGGGSSSESNPFRRLP